MMGRSGMRRLGRVLVCLGVWQGAWAGVEPAAGVEEVPAGAAALTVPYLWVQPEALGSDLPEGTEETQTLTVGNSTTGPVQFTVRTRKAAGAGVLAGLPAAAAVEADLTTVSGEAYEPGRLIVRFGRRADGAALSVQEENAVVRAGGGVQVRERFELVPGLSVVELPSGVSVEQGVRDFSKMAGVVYAQPDYRLHIDAQFPNDPRFGELWGLHNTGQSGGKVDADIDAPEGWEWGTGSDEVVVAVIDTGVDYRHPDLAGNMWVNAAEQGGQAGVDDDGNGYVDDIYGYDFDHNDGDPMDDHYHGTHCAGTVGAAGNNGEGITGVCWGVRIMAVKFLDSSGNGSTSDAIASVQYATRMGARVTSNSWGGGSYNQGLKDAIDAAGAAGILFVAAAGNNSTNNDAAPHYPSNYTSANLIAVLATDRNDVRASFSNYGRTSVDLGAPGVSILSCKPGGSYQTLSGTSMATPHVAGACALLWSVDAGLSAGEVKDILLRTVDPTLAGVCVSGGRMNLERALQETRLPWLEVAPEAGTLGPGETMALAVRFLATEGATGQYSGEIAIKPQNVGYPEVVAAATMTVRPDDLAAEPSTGWQTSGPEGGPFTPATKTYTLTNRSAAAVSWRAEFSADWLAVEPTEGVVGVGGSAAALVRLTPAAGGLPAGVHETTVRFENLGSGSVKARAVRLTVTPPDLLTEAFTASDNDLTGRAVWFAPNGLRSYYTACTESVAQFGTDPSTGGTALQLGDDDYLEVVLQGGAQASFFGQQYDRFYVGSNGYLTFGQGDTSYAATLERHFALPRISALFADLAPPGGAAVSWRQLADRAAVTYQNVPLFGDKTATNSFQVEIFFADGVIRVTWLSVKAKNGIVGLSAGRPLPAGFQESDLSRYLACCGCGDFNGNGSVELADLMHWSGHWLADGCGTPGWCGWTDLDRSGAVDLGDWTMMAGHWLTALRYRWGEPVLLPELNDSGNVATHPFLSRDGLTMYSARYVPNLGHKCIVEAGRSAPEGPFTSQRVVTELSVTGYNVAAPWVVPGGQRMYYHEIIGPGSLAVLKLAERDPSAGLWRLVRTLTEVQRTGYSDAMPSVSDDELVLTWHSMPSNGSEQLNIWMASRSAVSEPFANARVLDEISTPNNEDRPCLMPDGLTLYFGRADPSLGVDFYRAVRASRADRFGNVTRVELPASAGKWKDFLFVTPDEQRAYFNAGSGQGVMESKAEVVSTPCQPR